MIEMLKNVSVRCGSNSHVSVILTSSSQCLSLYSL